MDSIATKISQLLTAKINCKNSSEIKKDKNGNLWEDNHQDKINEMIKEYLPHGSGFDGDTLLDDKSTPERLIFNSGYHPMDEGGYYDGWIEFDVIITPSLAFGINLQVKGRFSKLPSRYFDMKNYIGDVFHDALANNEQFSCNVAN